MSNLLNCLRFRLLFNEFWEMSFKALTRPTIVMPTGEDPEPGANYFDFEISLTQICSKLRDTDLPSPKIYSIRTHCPTMPKKFQKDGEKIHLYMMTALSHDTKVIELISAFDKFWDFRYKILDDCSIFVFPVYRYYSFFSNYIFIDSNILIKKQLKNTFFLFDQTYKAHFFSWLSE